MDQWTIFDEIKAGTFKRVYLFYGPEAFIKRSAIDKLKERALAPGLEELNLTVLSAPSAQQVIESCETMPMMSDYRVVIVRDCGLISSGKAKDEAQDSQLLCDYLDRVPETTCLLFDADAAFDKNKKLSKALLALPGAVSFAALNDARLGQWMNQTLRPAGKRMARDACDMLAFYSGRDLTALVGELEKLAAYVQERQDITAQDVEAIATRTAECTVFTMVDALCEGRAQEAFRLLGVLLQDGEEYGRVLAMITRQYRNLMYYCEMRDRHMQRSQMSRLLGVPEFALGRLARQVGRRSFEQLRDCLSLCVQADYDIKRGALRDEAAVKRLMLVLLQN